MHRNCKYPFCGAEYSELVESLGLRVLLSLETAATMN